MFNLDAFRLAVDEDDRNRDQKWKEVEDDAISTGITREEWEHQEDIKDYGDYEYDEDGNEI